MTVAMSPCAHSPLMNGEPGTPTPSQSSDREGFCVPGDAACAGNGATCSGGNVAILEEEMP